MKKRPRPRNRNISCGKIVIGEIEMPDGAKAKGVTVDTGNDEKDLKLARELLGQVTPKQQPKSTPVADSAKLAMVIKKYQAEKIAEGSWTEKTAAEYEALYELLVQIVGNVEISTVTHKDDREFNLKTAVSR